MLGLPRIGTQMYVTHGEGVNFRSRLEGVDGDTLCLTAPLETTGITPPRPGHQLDVFWAQTRTRVILPCKLVQIADTAPYQWTLVANGGPRHSNRREFVRGGGGGPVRLLAEEDDDAVDGRLLDISEGGLRCWVPRAPQLGTGDKLQAAVLLSKDEVEVTGAVLDVRDAFDQPGKHVILTFQAGERVERRIRQHVFAWEIAERRQYEAR